MTVKEFCKLVFICQSYDQKSQWLLFFETRHTPYIQALGLPKVTISQCAP